MKLRIKKELNTSADIAVRDIKFIANSSEGGWFMI